MNNLISIKYANNILPEDVDGFCAWDIMQILHHNNQWDVIQTLGRLPIEEHKCYRVAVREIENHFVYAYGSKRFPHPMIEYTLTNRIKGKGKRQWKRQVEISRQG